MVIGTSLTFYRGPEAHDRLLEKLRATTGLPVSTMSQAIVDGLARGRRQAGRGRHRLYRRGEPAPEGTAGGGRLRGAVARSASTSSNSAGPARKSEADIIALSGKAVAKAPGADGVLISCGGLRTLGVAKPLEERHGLPVVSSTPAAFWAAMRLVGESGHVAGHGRLLEQAERPCPLSVVSPVGIVEGRFRFRDML